MSGALLHHAAVLSMAARGLALQSPGVGEVLRMASESDAVWRSWVDDLVDQRPAGEEGGSSLVAAWMAFDQTPDRQAAARAAKRLLSEPASRVVDYLVTPKSVLAIVRQDLGDWWDLALVRMGRQAFAAFQAGTPLESLSVRWLDTLMSDDADLFDQAVSDWKTRRCWQAAFRSAEHLALNENVPMPKRAAKKVRI